MAVYWPNMTTSQLLPGYQLIDSGEGSKLEKLGSRTIIRPSTLCSWKQRRPQSLWKEADATYNHDNAWSFSQDRFSQWSTTLCGVDLELELMSNGQIGLFPEHAIYLSEIEQRIRSLQKDVQKEIRVLSLFAYTGLATAFLGKLERVTVTHVDLSKRAIEWAKKNASLSRVPQDRIRWIADDALAFLARETRKNSYYDIIIIDPPSFSRVSKTNSWTLEEKLPEIVHLFLNVLCREQGSVFFTNHSLASTSEITKNLTLDYFDDENIEISFSPLSIPELSSTRALPAGSLITIDRTLPANR